MEWPDFYEAVNRDDLRRFYDHYQNVTADNHGRHGIHTGGRYASYLQLPMRGHSRVIGPTRRARIAPDR